MRSTRILERNLSALESGKRLIVNQGGARSSKTMSIAQLFIALALKYTGEVFSVVRKTMPSLRGSAMRDFFSLLEEYSLYSEKNHDKTNSIYRLGGNEIEFFGLDEPQKVRGRKRRFLWLNEANELTREDFTQLNLRTTGQIFMDYNPSEEDHWIYDMILTRPDCELIKSTYLDNPFLPKELIAEIERLKGEDENYWTIYGLGERGHRKSLIFSRYDLVDEMPDNPDETIFGLDFGFNNPTALVGIAFKDNELWLDECLYQTGLTNADLASQLPEHVQNYATIYCDSAEPQRIEELSRAGYNVMPAMKGPDSVKKGIDTIKSFKVHITRRSANVIRDWRTYKYKEDKNGLVLDEPVKFNDHACDAVRYAVATHATQGAFKVLFEV